MYPSAPPDAYNKFSAGAPPTAPPPPAAYQQQQHGANMDTSRPGGGLRKWSTGLFHCMDDPGNCLITCLCPCVTFGQVADIVDKGTCPCIASGLVYGLICASTGMGCLYSCLYRSKLRAEYDLDEGECPDILVHCCCEHLALCQEYRELKNRGFDLGIGWEANMDRQRRGVAGGGAVMGAPPAIPLGMIR
ncbi:cell number regulator 1 [Zea mays]|uniref:Cell number regulator 1 n=1 Tax=Zea mays TaxID=4577 RepID=K7UKY3_MAIZE|nr:cell number regulator 1 [Zea mays]ACF85498.1 unknown [Zea mays]AQK56390.1 Cell number regulator 1 [Zea mays]